jgi:hypothetical protein
VNCAHCDAPLPAGSRRDRRYCTKSCRTLASNQRRQHGLAPSPRWQHPALESSDPVLRDAAGHARELAATHGWSPSTLRCTLDGLTVLLTEHPAGEPVPLSAVRVRMSRHASRPRVAEVLTGLGLLHDDTTASVRAWIDRRTAELPAGFAVDVRAWLLVLLDGDARARPRAASSIYVYFGSVRPLLEGWAPTRGHLREITRGDVISALDAISGWPRRNALAGLRSLFRFARKHRLVFTDPTVRIKLADIERHLLPMIDEEIRAVEAAARTAPQRLVIALAAVQAAPVQAIRQLTLDDLDLPNRRITLAGHTQRLGDLTHQTLRTWIEHRRARWPHSPNRHVLISPRTALGTGPVSRTYLHRHLLGDEVDLERIRRDRVLHEALTAGPDPLHLSLVFNLSHSTASSYAYAADKLLDDHALEASDGSLEGTIHGRSPARR